MNYRRDYVGQKFGKLTVLANLPAVMPGPGYATPRPIRMVLARCECGKEKACPAYPIASGTLSSCGCTRNENARRLGYSKRKHGEYKDGVLSVEYQTWSNIKDRCLNPNNRHFKNYGGRGIAVCDKWRDDVAAFIEDVGRRPGKEYSIDRINNDGNYEPGNCRWATRSQQIANRRPPHMWPSRVDGKVPIRKTHCPRGHLYTAYKSERHCRVCNAIASRILRAKKNAIDFLSRTPADGWTVESLTNDFLRHGREARGEFAGAITNAIDAYMRQQQRGGAE